jgi:predicted PurR-regulated permease PerM
MERSEKSARRALLVLLLAGLVLVGAVFQPLAGALFLAAVIAMVLWPAHQWLTRGLKGRRGLAAGLLVGVVVVFVIGPLVGLSAFIVSEAISGVQFVAKTVQSEGTRGLIAKLPDPVEHQFMRLLDRAQIDTGELVKSAQEQVTKVGGTAAAAVGAAVSATGSFLFQGTMMVLALYFMLTNKEAILDWLDDASPLRKGQTRELFAEFVRVCKSVILSAVATSLVQAVAALVGYYIAQVPNPVFFFGLTFILAFVPALGAASVCLFTAALQLVTGHPWAALFLGVYGLTVVALIDNVAKPLLMKDDIEMHGAVVFFALIGGLAMFGAMGLLIGPLAVALFLALLRMYQRDYAADPKDRQAMREQRVGATQALDPSSGAAPKSSDEPVPSS